MKDNINDLRDNGVQVRVLSPFLTERQKDVISISFKAMQGLTYNEADTVLIELKKSIGFALISNP